MKIIKPSVEFISRVDGEQILKHLEVCGRTCYKSEGKIEDGSAERFVANNAIIRGHEAILEQYYITVRFVCDRGVSHEIVRHRMASYCQESTRYCNYTKDGFGSQITVIEPCFFEDCNSVPYEEWMHSCETTEQAYFNMLKAGCTPQEARSVLPNSLKTEVVMTANMREWRHFFKLRCDNAAHPQMREVAKMALKMFSESIPVIFDDLYMEYIDSE